MKLKFKKKLKSKGYGNFKKYYRFRLKNYNAYFYMGLELKVNLKV